MFLKCIFLDSKLEVMEFAGGYFCLDLNFRSEKFRLNYLLTIKEDYKEWYDLIFLSLYKKLFY